MIARATDDSLLRHSILIVEDEAVSRRALAMLLKLNGYETHAVPTAEEAIEIMDGGEVPEVALVDLDLPGMNGMDLIARLRREHPEVTPVLITATSRERLETMSGGCEFEYLRKPIELTHLMELIDRGAREC